MALWVVWCFCFGPKVVELVTSYRTNWAIMSTRWITNIVILILPYGQKKKLDMCHFYFYVVADSKIWKLHIHYIKIWKLHINWNTIFLDEENDLVNRYVQKYTAFYCPVINQLPLCQYIGGYHPSIVTSFVIYFSHFLS